MLQPSYSAPVQCSNYISCEVQIRKLLIMYRVTHKSLGISDLCGTVAGMVTPKGSMSTEGETLQLSVLPYRCSICNFCCLSWLLRSRVRELQRDLWITLYFSPIPCYLFILTPKCSPHHLTLKHPQPTILPQCERPSVTSIQNHSQNYGSLSQSF
jgi:hypothetical protein